MEPPSFVSSTKRIASLTLGLLFLAVPVFCAGTVAPVRAQETSKSPLVVLGDKDYPPYESLVDRKPSGINVDLWREIAKVLGRPLDLRLYQWADSQARVQRGDAKLLTFMSINKERVKIYDFSEPTFTSRFPLFVIAELADNFDISDLTGKRIPIKRGGFPRTIIETIHPEAEMVFVDSALEGFNKLLLGEVDGVMEDERVGYAILGENNFHAIRATPKTLAVTTGHIAVVKGNSALLGQIDEALKVLKASGKFDQIAGKVAHSNIIHVEKETIIIFVLSGLVAIVLIFGLGVVVYVLRVRRTNVALLIEITEHKHSEDALRESEERYAFAVSGSAEGIWVRDFQNGKYYSSPRWNEILGYDEDELKIDFDGFFNIIHPDDRMMTEETRRAHLEDRVPYDIEYRLRHKSGDWIWVRSRGQATWDENGIPLRMGGSITDITEHKRFEALSRSLEDRFLDAIEAISESVYLYDENDQFVMGNSMLKEEFSSFAHLLVPGTAIKSMVEAIWDNLLHPDQKTDREAWMKEILDFPDKPRSTVVQHLKDGRWVEVVRYRTSDNGTIIIRNDITERKQLDEALLLSQTALDHAGDAALWVDQNARIVYANNMASEMLGYSHEELLDLEVFDYDPSATMEDFQQSWEQLKNGGPVTFETTHRTKAGALIPVEVTLNYLKFGEKERIASFSRDISERRRAEEQLRQSEKRLSSAQELAQLGYFDRDINSGNIYYSDITCRILGFEPDTKMNFDKFWECVHPDDRENLKSSVEKLIDAGNILNAEYRFIRPDGEERIIQQSSTTFADENNVITNVVGAILDITDGRRREDQLRQALKMEAVGQLTGGIAHDFNNMLAGLQGNLDLMSDELSSEAERAERLERAKSIVKRGANLTKHLLAFSRKQNLQPKPTDVGDLIDHMHDLMRRSLGETISINMDFASELWPAMVDPHQLENAILNLAINARDAMPKGGELSINGHNIASNEVTGSLSFEMAAGDYIVVVVHDMGRGIPKDQIDNVFDPFFTTKEVGEGSGLGLSMVYGFVKQSGGYVTIDSTEGVGTAVTLYLPRAEPVAAEIADAATAPSPAIGDGERIMVIEDDPDVRDVMTATLEKLGYEVIDGGDGLEAVNIGNAQEQGIDLLLTDVVLPHGNNGPDLADALSRRWRQMKVLMMTGYAENDILRTTNEDIKGTSKNTHTEL